MRARLSVPHTKALTNCARRAICCGDGPARQGAGLLIQCEKALGSPNPPPRVNPKPSSCYEYGMLTHTPACAFPVEGASGGRGGGSFGSQTPRPRGELGGLGG